MPKKVKQVMAPVFETWRGGDLVSTAAQTMKRLGVNSMVVMDHMQVSGILTDKNIIENSTAQGLDPQKTTVRDVMTCGEIRCAEDQDIEEIEKKMDQMNTQYLVVLDSNGKPLGMISQEQLA